MSGSSLDGLDMAWVEFSGNLTNIQWHLHAGKTIDLPPKIKQRFQDVHALSGQDLAFLDQEFCTWLANHVLQFKEDYRCPIDYLASHGHTLYHNPRHGYTYQLGNGGYIAGKTGVDTIADFRTTDIACNGQGAPFAPIADKHLFAAYNYLLNLGGIANITSTHEEETIAYDVCPCNQILNYLASKKGRPYDNEGALAKEGSIESSLLKELNTIDYYQKAPPKSIDNTWIAKTYFPILDSYTCAIEDKLATVVLHIATHISESIATLGGSPGKLLVTGGGAFNTFLTHHLELKLKDKNIEVVIPDDNLVNFKEAILIAFMGYLRVMDIPNVLPSVTGSSRPTISGAIYKGS